ncbi:hypothetical protein SAMN05428949_6989 [Chitinophaga sp. YR627]|nr:hypothetical protein SAMN05428949_6989 [Chitinophaga sp. YR627]
MQGDRQVIGDEDALKGRWSWAACRYPAENHSAEYPDIGMPVTNERVLESFTSFI